jgi:Chorismate synthase
MSSEFGKLVKFTIFGQSHSPAIGVVIDGIPAGEVINMDEIHKFMARRTPSDAVYSTSRKEADIPEILSGIVDGITCGAPITAVIRNTDAKSKDYSDLINKPRPSHSDYAAFMKYGNAHDIRGGGHFSGRLTAPLCFAGAVCKQILKRHGITADTRIKDEELMMKEIESAAADGDSVGGVIECVIDGIPAGVGEPMFDGLENKIAQAVFAVPAVKGIEFGSGFEGAKLRGSVNNDAYYIDNGNVKTLTNNNGGIIGGISNGMPVIFRVAIKPVPSISQLQKTVDLRTMTDTELTISGRHDTCIVPRALPCIESAALIAVLDLFYERRSKL